MTLQVRFTGSAALVKALYDHLHAKIPRGPRGGSLYRCTLKDRDNGLAQLYADVPADVYADLFDPSFRMASVSTTSSTLVQPETVVFDGEAVETLAMAIGRRYRIGRTGF